MPKWIEFAHIAAAATYRSQDDLFSVIDAGITKVVASSLPARHEITLIVQFCFTEPDTNTREHFSLVVTDPDDLQMAEVTGEIDATRPSGADLTFPFTFTVVQRYVLTLQKRGYHTARITLGKDLKKELKLLVDQGTPGK